MLKLIAAAAGLALAICAAARAAPPDATTDLASTGRLRAAINFGNPVLAQKDPDTDAPGGVSVDLARELGRQLGVPVELVPFDEAGAVFDALGHDEWDVAFLAVDPARAASIDFTEPYVLIEGTYLVPVAAPILQATEVDRDGVRVGVVAGSAYDLFLTRTLLHARIVRAADSAEATDLLRHHDVDALAGIRQVLDAYVHTHPETRVVSGEFMRIPQAVGTPKGREAGARYLRGFIDEMKASGFIAEALGMSGQGDVLIVPAAGQ